VPAEDVEHVRIQYQFYQLIITCRNKRGGGNPETTVPVRNGKVVENDYASGKTTFFSISLGYLSIFNEDDINMFIFYNVHGFNRYYYYICVTFLI